MAWNDGVVRLVGAENSKIVHRIVIGKHGEAGITCLGWVSNFTGKRNTGVGSIKGESSWQTQIEKTLSETKGRDNFDLPRDLTLIDIESSLPKLSDLPADGTS